MARSPHRDHGAGMMALHGRVVVLAQLSAVRRSIWPPCFQQTFAIGDFSYRYWQGWSEGGWNLLRSSWGAFGWLDVAATGWRVRIMQVMLWRWPVCGSAGSTSSGVVAVTVS